ncbi:MAG: aminopeptidase P family protein, partial [Desulfobulbia bacterium]
MFSEKTYVERRQNLRNKIQSGGLLLFLGNDEAPMNYFDNTYRYRQDSSFLYFFGLNQPGLAAIIDLDEGTDTIYGDDLTIDHVVWMGSHPTVTQNAEAVGVGNTGTSDQLVTRLQSAQAQGRKIHFLPPYRADNKIKLFRWLALDPDDLGKTASVEFIRGVVDLRNIKSAEEIAELDKAANTTVEMHLAAMRKVRPGITEAEVAATVHQVALAAGGDISFPIIATINGQTLHNHYHGNTLKSGDMFLLDAGAETAMGYAGDMSSTIPVDGKFTDRQRVVYDIALESHNAAIEALKPGKRFLDIYKLSARVIVEGMKDLGLMKGDAHDAVEAGAHAMFFPCGLGHMLGLDVHDMENLGEQYVGYTDTLKKETALFGLKSLRLGRELEVGNVLTIEPGIYFIPELFDMWKAERRHAQFLDFDKIPDSGKSERPG